MVRVPEKQDYYAIPRGFTEDWKPASPVHKSPLDVRLEEMNRVLERAEEALVEGARIGADRGALNRLMLDVREAKAARSRLLAIRRKVGEREVGDAHQPDIRAASDAVAGMKLNMRRLQQPKERQITARAIRMEGELGGPARPLQVVKKDIDLCESAYNKKQIVDLCKTHGLAIAGDKRQLCKQLIKAGIV